MSPIDSYLQGKDVEKARKRLASVVKQGELLKSVQVPAGNEIGKVRAALRESLAILSTSGEFLGLFTTPSLAYGRWFAKGKVVKLSIPMDQLKAGLTAGTVYAGFEYTQEQDKETFMNVYTPAVELVFLTPSGSDAKTKAMDLLFQSYVDSEDSQGGAFNN